MLNKNQLDKLRVQGRSFEAAKAGDPDLGQLELLPGTWKNLPNLPGRGWNMIALPFASSLDYRLLVNQYNEELKFSLVDKAIPNRGIKENGETINSD